MAGLPNFLSINMEFSENTDRLSEADLTYANWFSRLPDERKSRIFADMVDFGIESVIYTVRKENPISTKAEALWRFMELHHKEAVTPEVFEFMRAKMSERVELEWKARFKKMRRELGWTFDEMARFIGAESGNSLKSSVSRQVPAFAKLAVCVFEEMKKAKSKVLENSVFVEAG